MRLHSIAIVAGLVAAWTARAQGTHVASIEMDSGRVTVAVTHDSGWFSVCPRDGCFSVRMDSLTIGKWADNAAALQGPTGDSAQPSYSGARIEYMDTVRHRLQAVTLVRLSADSNAPYRLNGEDGDRKGTIVLSGKSMRTVFAAMHGQAPILSPHTPIYFDFQLEKHAAPRPGSRTPEYPADLVSGRVNGHVETSFVVDSTGRIDLRSFRVIRTTHQEFADAVRRALPGMRFWPAEINGRPVAEVVYMPFAFNAGR